MSAIGDNPDRKAAEVGSRDPAAVASDARSAAPAARNDDERDERIVRDEFESLDSDLVDVAKFANGKEDHKELWPVDEDGDKPGLPEDARSDTADLSVSEYDRSGGGR